MFFPSRMARARIYAHSRGYVELRGVRQKLQVSKATFHRGAVSGQAGGVAEAACGAFQWLHLFR